MSTGDDELFDIASEPDDRTAVVDLNDLDELRSPTTQDRHLLVGVHGTMLGRVRRLGGEPVRIGRHQEAELWLDDGGVSRRHAEIVLQEGHYLLRDLASANGPFVQGERISEHVLKDGDVMQFGPSAVFRYSLADRDQEEMLVQLYAASVTDPLTGARNREFFDSQLVTEISFARRHRTDLSLIIFDIDHFKLVNDNYGHPTGDGVLVEIARSVRDVVRNEDVFSRYGGEEFAIVLRDVDITRAAGAAERLRQTVESMVMDIGTHSIRVTISLGCASIGESSELQPAGLIGVADRRLYAAKRSGRNRVVAAG